MNYHGVNIYISCLILMVNVPHVYDTDYCIIRLFLAGTIVYDYFEVAHNSKRSHPSTFDPTILGYLGEKPDVI